MFEINAHMDQSCCSLALADDERCLLPCYTRTTTHCCNLRRATCPKDSAQLCCPLRCRVPGKARSVSCDDPKLFLGPEGHEEHDLHGNSWRRILQVGAAMSLFGAPEIIFLDDNYGLDIRQRQARYPLKEVKRCERTNWMSSEDATPREIRLMQVFCVSDACVCCVVTLSHISCVVWCCVLLWRGGSDTTLHNHGVYPVHVIGGPEHLKNPSPRRLTPR